MTTGTASLAFGSTIVNTPTIQSLTLTSTGTAPVTITSAAVSGVGFTMVGAGLPVTLNPQQAMTLQVQFNPASPGAATGQIVISSNSTSGSTSMVALTGTGTTASAPQTSPQLAVSSTSLSFGSVTVNTGSTQSLTLTSTGTAPVTVSSAAISGAGFSIVAQTFPVTLNPTQSVTIQIQFKPTAAGAASGQITINSNVNYWRHCSRSLGRHRYGRESTVDDRQLDRELRQCRSQCADDADANSRRAVTTAERWNSAAITGAGFTIVGGSFPVTLNPGQTLALQLQFIPTTAGALTGQITISSNSISGNTTVVALSGTGTAVAHEVDLSWNGTSSTDPAAGYNIYRATGGGSLVLINASPNVAVVYVDGTVASGANYSYVVKSVDSSGVESVPSNQITVTIP